MKKLIKVLAMFILFIAGCSGVPDWKADLAEGTELTANEPIKVAFLISADGKPVPNLTVSANFEMKKMDHGSLSVQLSEESEGVYSGNVTLPMEGEWQAFLTITDGKSTKEEIVQFKVEKAGVTTSNHGHNEAVATINGENVTNDDIEFYRLINVIQLEMYREADKKKYTGKELDEAMKYWDEQEEAVKDQNTLLTQIIRLRAMALLAEEKGHQATSDEIANRMAETKAAYETSLKAQEMIKQYGEEKFWDVQQKQQKAIVLVSKVQQDVLNNVKKENPNAEEKEINMLAEKKYEELLVSQVGTLNIKINNS